MINKYQLQTQSKDAEEESIPNFDTLNKEIIDKSFKLIMGLEDEYACLIDDAGELVSEELHKTSSHVPDAFFSELGDFRIHEAFAGKTLTEISKLIADKYELVQKLKQEYDSLKEENVTSR